MKRVAIFVRMGDVETSGGAVIKKKVLVHRLDNRSTNRGSQKRPMFHGGIEKKPPDTFQKTSTAV
jgi:hypothetical protein